MSRYRPPIGSTERARRLRKKRTKADWAMTRLLRAAFPDQHFRFQVPIRAYYADFASHRAKLIVEVDGGQHVETSDRERTRVLENEGYRLIRFWNNEVLGNPNGVARMIEAAIVSNATPTLTLPHQGGGNPSEAYPWHV